MKSMLRGGELFNIYLDPIYEEENLEANADYPDYSTDYPEVTAPSIQNSAIRGGGWNSIGWNNMPPSKLQEILGISTESTTVRAVSAYSSSASGPTQMITSYIQDVITPPSSASDLGGGWSPEPFITTTQDPEGLLGTAGEQ